MPVTTDSLFGLQQLGESVALFDELEKEMLLQGLFKPEPCYADSYRFDREDFEMSLAPFVAGRKSPSIGVKTGDKKVETIAIAHIRMHKIFPSADLFVNRAAGEISDNAAAEVAKGRMQLRRRARLARERISAMALRGTVTVDATQFPDSETNISIVRAVTALTAESAIWSTATTKIVSKDIQVWRKDLREKSGFDPRRALFGTEITQYLLANTEAKEWLGQVQKGVDMFSAAQYANLGGIADWTEYNGFFIPVGGAATRFIDADEFFLLPPDQIRARICRMIEGYGEIPVNAIGGPGAGQAGAIAGAIRAPTPGYFEYALPLDGDPPGIKLVAGDYFMALVKLPEAIGRQASVIA